MKKTKKAMTFSFLLSFLMLLSSCNANDRMFDTEPSETQATEYESSQSQTIRDLENKIIELQQSQYISDAEHQKELQRLQTLLAELKSQVSTSTDTQAQETESASAGTDKESVSDESTSLPQFLYTQENGKAIITGYTGTDAHLVIPSEIDGYQVIEIGDNAISSQTLKSVIVSNGIEKLNWFAFRDCPALVSVTLPDSVTSIAYSAFAPQDSSFTIYCHSNSFAYKYAKSYGLNYAII